jgi:membrane-bound lytic murein transglycosylase A
MHIKKFKTLLFLLIVSACLIYFWPTRKAEKKELQKKEADKIIWTSENSLVEYKQQINFKDDFSKESFLVAIDRSINYLEKQPTDSNQNFGKDLISRKRQLEHLKQIKNEVLQNGFSANLSKALNNSFKFYVPNTERVLFTGYYEPELKASRTSTNHYQFPIYKKPDDLLVLNLNNFLILKDYLPADAPKELRVRVEKEKLLPYFNRQEIDQNRVLTNKNLELFWLEDLIEIFFLQIQGSGALILENGERVRVSYAEKNGQPYRPIGKWLHENNKMPLNQINMQSIKDYLKNNPKQVSEILNYNPSYVFFREAKDGPVGALNQTVTAMRSIATDLRIIPKGVLAYVQLEIPIADESGQIIEHIEKSFFVFNQDTGGAIRGPNRIDLFVGTGEKAGQLAGILNKYGKIYYLAAREL